MMLGPGTTRLLKKSQTQKRETCIIKLYTRRQWYSCSTKLRRYKSPLDLFLRPHLRQYCLKSGPRKRSRGDLYRCKIEVGEGRIGAVRYRIGTGLTANNIIIGTHFGTKSTNYLHQKHEVYPCLQ